MQFWQHWAIRISRQLDRYLIDRAELDSINIPENESFGLVADDLVEAVASAGQRKPVRTASLWQYEIAHDRWRNISQLVRADATLMVSRRSSDPLSCAISLVYP